MTAEIGRVLGGRYRLVAPIGMGASAQVYLADDVKLRRRVAVKMLHDALAGDTEFLRRFRAEARAAAALSHPNVMAVYDWSDGSGDGEAAFIVTEYLAGGSLRAVLDASSNLTTAQALAVGLEAARALDYAHRRGFVHRDIKPANLLFGDEQRLRIADFGLARALAEAAWTEPQGAVLGTARYASPEQAKGEALSGKADVYSLALVMIEAVTGEVPFVADTTLGTLMARVDRPLVVPDDLGPLAEVLTLAGNPDPEQRIDARELAKGLLRAARELPRPAPLPLVGAVESAVLASPDLDPTIHAEPAAGEVVVGSSDLTDDDLELDPPHWVNQTEPVDPAEEEPPVVAPPVAPEVDEPSTAEVAAIPLVAPATAVDDGDDGESDEEPKRRRRWPWVALVVLLLLGIGGTATALATRGDDAPAGPLPTLPVPDLVGRTEQEARAIAIGAGWEVDVAYERRDGSTKGEVLETTPEAGTRLADGRTLDLVVSEGQTIVDVPSDLAGMSVDDATAALAAVGLEAEVADTAFSEDVAKDAVIRTARDTPEQLEKGSTVRLLASKGPEPRVIPGDLAGSTEEGATGTLQSLGLEVAIVRSFSDDVAEGRVISVLPAAGTSVERGSTVTIEVSRGPELVAVPDISGAGSISAAVAILNDAGLQDGDVSGKASGSPAASSPAAGTMVRPGSTVDIILR